MYEKQIEALETLLSDYQNKKHRFGVVSSCILCQTFDKGGGTVNYCSGCPWIIFTTHKCSSVFQSVINKIIVELAKKCITLPRRIQIKCWIKKLKKLT